MDPFAWQANACYGEYAFRPPLTDRIAKGKRVHFRAVSPDHAVWNLLRANMRAFNLRLEEEALIKQCDNTYEELLGKLSREEQQDQ